LIEFGQFAARDRKQRGEEKPETFTFLGFTHFCGKRQNGAFGSVRGAISDGCPYRVIYPAPLRAIMRTSPSKFENGVYATC
jgi:hypothetical protein